MVDAIAFYTPSRLGFDVALTRIAAPLTAAAMVGATALLAPAVAVFLLAALAAAAIVQAEQDRPPRFLGLAVSALIGATVGASAGLAAGVGALFAWRLAIEAHESIAEARQFARRAGRPQEASLRALWSAWATPAHALAVTAYTAPHLVAGLPLSLPHAPLWVPLATAIAVLVGLVDWMARRAADWRLGQLAPAPTAHLFAHHLVFLACLGAAFDITAGVVALLAWRLARAARLGQASFTAVP